MCRNLWAEMCIRHDTKGSQSWETLILPFQWDCLNVVKQRELFSCSLVSHFSLWESSFLGSLAELACRRSPRHAVEPMTWWYVLSTGLLGPVLRGWARASHLSNIGLPMSAQQYFCKGKALSARKLPCFQHMCSVRVHIRTDTLLNVKG